MRLGGRGVASCVHSSLHWLEKIHPPVNHTVQPNHSHIYKRGLFRISSQLNICVFGLFKEPGAEGEKNLHVQEEHANHIEKHKVDLHL